MILLLLIIVVVVVVVVVLLLIIMIMIMIIMIVLIMIMAGGNDHLVRPVREPDDLHGGHRRVPPAVLGPQAAEGAEHCGGDLDDPLDKLLAFWRPPLPSAQQRGDANFHPILRITGRLCFENPKTKCRRADER